MRAGSARVPAGQAGFTYLWLLAAIAVLAIGMSIIGPQWARQTQRDREAELLRVGAAYATAIEHYYRMPAGGARQLPRSVDDLLLDRRFTTPVRHLRSAYTDPLQPGLALELVRTPAGEIRGIASSSLESPIRQTAWSDGRHTLPATTPSTRYRDWQFLADLSS
jgi:type II secretory pathway pseudopilin PulG